jgi:hypothetical protein
LRGRSSQVGQTLHSSTSWGLNTSKGFGSERGSTFKGNALTQLKLLRISRWHLQNIKSKPGPLRSPVSPVWLRWLHTHEAALQKETCCDYEAIGQPLALSSPSTPWPLSWAIGF